LGGSLRIHLGSIHLIFLGYTPYIYIGEFLSFYIININKCTNGFNKNIKKKKRKFIQNKQKKKKDIKKI